MKILLDTCTFLWAAMEPDKLSTAAARLFTDPANLIFLSAISAYEITVKHGLGRLPLPDPPRRFVVEQRVALGIEPLDFAEEAVFQVEGLAPIHRDPFDRMLIGQALAHELVILTPDHQVRQYPGLRTDW